MLNSRSMRVSRSNNRSSKCLFEGGFSICLFSSHTVFLSECVLKSKSSSVTRLRMKKFGVMLFIALSQSVPVPYVSFYEFFTLIVLSGKMQLINVILNGVLCVGELLV